MTAQTRSFADSDVGGGWQVGSDSICPRAARRLFGGCLNFGWRDRRSLSGEDPVAASLGSSDLRSDSFASVGFGQLCLDQGWGGTSCRCGDNGRLEGQTALPWRQGSSSGAISGRTRGLHHAFCSSLFRLGLGGIWAWAMALGLIYFSVYLSILIYCFTLFVRRGFMPVISPYHFLVG
ncbi:hypothetical protein RchiOBHm_Chr2g0105231 [Rosa chinensis]|uniref:Transmembrane protein n=1 Tax=Rosa chinensis TaxID=74649 RepID=A0A2P6RND5_ROSCH|nr:hypothetical protein RchiOBHm_Chr2g0105231 [Rosa chinensis]